MGVLQLNRSNEFPDSWDICNFGDILITSFHRAPSSASLQYLNNGVVSGQSSYSSRQATIPDPGLDHLHYLGILANLR